MKLYPKVPIVNEEFFAVIELAEQAAMLFGSPEMLKIPHGDLEKAAEPKVREFGKRLIQANLDTPYPTP